MQQAEEEASLAPFFWIAVIVLAIWAGAGMAVLFHFEAWSDRGQFGDMFGAVNALFSGLAFAGLIYTVHLQRKELGLQRRELQLTREELKRTAAAQEASERALNQQVLAMEAAAKLNALSSVIEHYGVVIRYVQAHGSSSDWQEAESQHLAYVGQLEAMLKGLLRKDPPSQSC